MKRAVLAACCLLCGTALAEERVRFRYIAPPECPTEQEFRAEVRARLLRDTAERETSWGEGVSAEVRLEPAERRATLVLEEPGVPPVERTVEGDTCAELASGVALITALAFGAARERTEAQAVTAPAAAEPKPAASTSAPVRTEPRAAEATKARPENDDRNASGAPASRSTPLGLEGGAGGLLNTWSAPGGVLGADAFFRLAPRVGESWAARLSGVYGFGDSSVGGRRADFRIFLGRAEGCPVWQIVPNKLLGEGCLALDLGGLRGQGEEGSALLQGASRTVFWAAAVVAARLRARFGGRFSVEGQGELGLPLVRHEFVFQAPAERIFRTPTVGFGARLGLGVKFL